MRLIPEKMPMIQNNGRFTERTVQSLFAAIKYITRRSVSRAGATALLFAILAIFLTPTCGSRKSPASQKNLSPDEEYLVNTYVRIINANDLFASDSTKAESLFTYIDSTLDSLRIANTINTLNRDPDRWIDIFKTINEKLQEGKKGK